MEQWVLDGRDTIRDRGFSRIPQYVEEDGYTVDITGGLRGMLKKVPTVSNSTKRDGETTTVHADPNSSTGILGSGEIGEGTATPADATSGAPHDGADGPSGAINYAKGLPQLYAECEVDYFYRFNGRIVDSNVESIALEELIQQLKKEEAEAEKMRAMQAEFDAATAAKGDSAEAGDSAAAEPADSKGGSSADAAAANGGGNLPTETIFSNLRSHPLTSKILVDGTTAFPTPTKIPTIGAYYPLDLVLGAGQVTQAMDEALLAMHEGEETEWWVDPAFAFRDHGLRTKFGSIPADASIQMKVKLIRFNNPMSSLERVVYATQLKDDANKILGKALQAEREEGPAKKAEAAALLQEAVLAYNNALNKLGKTFIYKQKMPPRQANAEGDEGGASSASQQQPVKEDRTREEQIQMDAQLRAVLFTNLSMCWFKRDDLARSTDYVERAIKCSPSYSKAIYRKALIEERRCNFDEAIALLETIKNNVASSSSSSSHSQQQQLVASASVNVGDVDAKIAALRATSAQQDNAQRRTYQGMFGKGL